MPTDETLFQGGVERRMRGQRRRKRQQRSHRKIAIDVRQLDRRQRVAVPGEVPFGLHHVARQIEQIVDGDLDALSRQQFDQEECQPHGKAGAQAACGRRRTFYARPIESIAPG